jgi:hypothetical protein
MTKRKDAVALFDLISRGKTQQAGPGLNVPGWFSKRPPPGPPGMEAPEPPAEGAAVEAPAPAEPSAPPPLGPFAPAAPAEPMISAADGRLHFSLTYVFCAAMALGLIAVLLGAFWLGRVTARPGAPPPNPPPAPGGTGRPGGGETSAPPPPPPERTKGKWYLVIQGFNGMSTSEKQDAYAIADYCNKNNHPCDVWNFRNHHWIVWSLKPFDDPKSKEAQDYARSIEDLGNLYKPPRGRGKYDFNQRHNGIFDPTFHQAP